LATGVSEAAEIPAPVPIAAPIAVKAAQPTAPQFQVVQIQPHHSFLQAAPAAVSAQQVPQTHQICYQIP